jgi:hypothetical protein
MEVCGLRIVDELAERWERRKVDGRKDLRIG